MLEESWDFLSSHPAVCSLCRPQSKDARRTLLLRYTFIQTRRWKANGACWVQQKTECHHTFVELRRGSAVVFCALATVAGGYDGDILVKREWKWSIVVEGMSVGIQREEGGSRERWCVSSTAQIPSAWSRRTECRGRVGGQMETWGVCVWAKSPATRTS